ncbi:hypothetical protein [Paenibacillus sp. FSL H8-0034]|uniref:hypothetical protein n=1 Tax=Paenibacillus sp. FSL H8-0034 TaxID=2954671 RepID=UPI0030F93AA6
MATVSAASGTPTGDVTFNGPNGLNETVVLIRWLSERDDNLQWCYWLCRFERLDHK